MHVVGNTDQAPLGFHFLEAAQVESSKAQVLLDIAKYTLWFDTAWLAQGDARLGEQVFRGLSAVYPEFEADLPLPFGTALFFPRVWGFPDTGVLLPATLP